MSPLKSITAFLAAAAVERQRERGLCSGIVRATEQQDLPDLGSPANAAISIDDEYHVPAWAIVNEIRKAGVILTDPEVAASTLRKSAISLSSQAEEGQHQFYYFVIRDPDVNAFAMPGGFVAINSGLILATRNENELAGVLAHETAHVTQRHIVRQLIDQSHEGLLATAAMLAAILLGATAGRGNPDAMEGADSGRAERHDSASDQLHPRQRIRSRPHRHRHHGERRLRSAWAWPASSIICRTRARNRAASMPSSS